MNSCPARGGGQKACRLAFVVSQASFVEGPTSRYHWPAFSSTIGMSSRCAPNSPPTTPTPWLGVRELAQSRIYVVVISTEHSIERGNQQTMLREFAIVVAPATCVDPLTGRLLMATLRSTHRISRHEASRYTGTDSLSDRQGRADFVML